MLALAAVILCRPLTVTTGVVTAVLGALAGGLIADRASNLSRSQLRLGTVLAVAAATLVLGAWAARMIVGSSQVAGLLGSVPTLHLSEALLWLFLVAPTVFALRFLAARRPLWAVAEVLAICLAIATGFAAHRDGMVHRPLTIGDWAWSRGIDPVLIFLVLGGATAFLLASFLLSEERKRRIPLHMSALFLVALALLAIVRVSGLPKPQGAGDLGLTGEPEAEEEQDEKGQGRGQGGKPDDQLGDLEFKDEYRSNGDQAPVAVVVLHDDYSPPSGVYYFRQSVFSQYNGRRLVQALREDVDRDIVKRFPFELMEIEAAPPVSDRRMSLRTSMGLVVDHIRPFALDSPAAIRPIRNPNPLHFQRAFEVRSHVQTMPYEELIGQRPGDVDWGGEQWRHYTEAPSDSRYDELAEKLMSRLRAEYRDDPLAQALAVKAHLDENGIYSRRSKHAGAGDPAASFLFGDLTGYCVHFAHAAAYLYRSLDIPARVAAGYAVEEGARAGGSSIMIRSGDAHAWPEIYLDGVGWVVVDLAPQQTLDEPLQSPDQALQRMLGEMMRQTEEETLLEDELRERLSLAAIGRFLLRLLAVLLVIGYAVKLYRRLAPSLVRPAELYRVAYRAALDRLAAVGLRRRFGESREQFAERSGGVSPTFGRLTEEHLKTALGSKRVADGRQLLYMTEGVRREVRQGLPWWKRWLGTVNPVSWMLVR
ncbi:MAG: transglutaminase domain-containing protein [bacterium]|nr:transglutaminase domain-containing protein [bacterium]